MVTIYDLAQIIKNILGKLLHPINIIGTRHGEKVHEVLLFDRKWHFQKI